MSPLPPGFAARNLATLEEVLAEPAKAPAALADLARVTWMAAVVADLSPQRAAGARRVCRRAVAAARRLAPHWSGEDVGEPGLDWLLAGVAARRAVGAGDEGTPWAAYTTLAVSALRGETGDAALAPRLALGLAAVEGSDVPRVEVGPDDFLRGEEASRAACDRIEGVSLFGQRTVRAAPLLDRFVASSLYAALQDGRVATAGRYLRCLAYLGAGEAVRREARRELARGPGPGSAEGVGLDLTAAVLWAVAEGVGEYRLFAHLGRGRRGA